MDLHALDPKALHRFSELRVTHDNSASAADNRLSSICNIICFGQCFGKARDVIDMPH